MLHKTLQSAIEVIFSSVQLLHHFWLPIIKPIINRILESCEIEVNGSNSGSIKVLDNRVYTLMAAKGFTGFVEAYINGFFDCDNLSDLMAKTMNLKMTLIEKWHPYRILKYLTHRYFDALTVTTTPENVNKHYDLSADMIRDLYGPSAPYSTMLLDDANEIEKANVEDLDAIMDAGTFRAREKIAKKLMLQPGMKVLDIGCGFGGLAKHLAEQYQVEVTGVTISKDMAVQARKVCEGLPVNIELRDYRTVTGKFDRIVSIEMFEHVGENHHREYFSKVNDLLADNGIFVFQASTIELTYVPAYTPMFEVCFDMYVYFGTLEEIANKSRGLLTIEHLESLSFYAGLTYKAVSKKLIGKKDVLVKKYSEKYCREWLFYISWAQAGGESAKNRMYQIVFSKNGLQSVPQF